MTDDIYVCGHCGKEMIRGKDEIVYGCYWLETRNIHCAYLCQSCFDAVDMVSYTENLDE